MLFLYNFQIDLTLATQWKDVFENRYKGRAKELPLTIEENNRIKIAA